MWSIHVVVMAGLIPHCPGPFNLLDRHWIWVITKQCCAINFDGRLNDTPCCPVIVTSLGMCITAMISATRDLQTQCHMVIASGLILVRQDHGVRALPWQWVLVKIHVILNLRGLVLIINAEIFQPDANNLTFAG